MSSEAPVGTGLSGKGPEALDPGNLLVPEPHPRERGMILVNVLVIVVLATAVLAIMLAGQDSQVERTQQLRSAAQAMAIARGGELSAIVALRRDLASGSTTDTLTEPWANIGDKNARIVGGHFSFVVADAQSHFNINNLARGDAVSTDVLRQMALAVGVKPDHLAGVLAALKAQGPVADLSALRGAGLSEAEVQSLSAFCTALPTPTTVNVNTAPEPLLALMTGNPAVAHAMVMMRARDNSGVSSSAMILPPGTGVTSDYFWARGRVTIGTTVQQLTSLLHRRQDNGKVVVSAIRRWRGAAPLGAPPFPN
jgi:general secretion pathway protein K